MIKHLGRVTEAALKFVRTHPDRVPKYTEYKSKMPLALFFCRIVYNFANSQGLQKGNFLDRWLFYTFPESAQEKLHLYLQKVRLLYPSAGLFTILRELARASDPLLIA